MLAWVFGTVLILAEIARNWGDWQWWPFWLVDFIAAALLLAGSALYGRRHRLGHPLLAGAWGFTSAMFYMSFWSHVAAFDQPAEGNLAQGPLTVVIGAMWLTTIVGFALAVLGRNDAASGD